MSFQDKLLQSQAKEILFHLPILQKPTLMQPVTIIVKACCLLGFMISLGGVIRSDAASPEAQKNDPTRAQSIANDTGGLGRELSILTSEPPVVVQVATAAGPLSSCDTVREAVTLIQVTIQDDSTAILGADDPANYRLVQAGPDKDFSTINCMDVSGDDTLVDIVNLSLVSSSPISVTTQLNFQEIEPDLYRLLVCDAITDTDGNALDGDDDGTTGGDFVLPMFRADPNNLFGNGHFDDCPVTLSPWIIFSTPPNAIQPGMPGSDDADGSPLSASARVSHFSAEPSSLAQCVAVQDLHLYESKAQVRFTPAIGAVARFDETCTFFDQTACTGANLDAVSAVTMLDDSEGNWLTVVNKMASPFRAVSALCDFTIEAVVGSDHDFEVSVDALSLIPDQAMDIIYLPLVSK